MLDQIGNFVSNNLPASIGIATVVLDMVLRLVKSDKPLSIARGAAVAMHKISKILSGMAEFLDKILPQNIK